MTSIGNKEVFAKNLTFYIEKSGKTQKFIAEKIGVPTSTISSWATAQKYPRIDKIAKLAEFFGIHKSDLIEQRSIDAIEENPVKMAILHFEMTEDVDFVRLFEDFKVLDDQDRETVMRLAHGLAQIKTEA